MTLSTLQLAPVTTTQRPKLTSSLFRVAPRRSRPTSARYPSSTSTTLLPTPSTFLKHQQDSSLSSSPLQDSTRTSSAQPSERCGDRTERTGCGSSGIRRRGAGGRRRRDWTASECSFVRLRCRSEGSQGPARRVHQVTTERLLDAPSVDGASQPLSVCQALPLDVTHGSARSEWKSPMRARTDSYFFLVFSSPCALVTLCLQTSRQFRAAVDSQIRSLPFFSL